MNALEFSRHIESVEFEQYIRKVVQLSLENETRIWEKSIPLWLAVYFGSKDVAPHRMNGNFSIKPSHPQVEKLLAASLKSKKVNHADFAISHIDTKEISPVGVIEIKSLLNYKKSELAVESYYKDICVAYAHKILMGEKGRAFAMLINIPLNGKNSLCESELLEKLNKIHRKRIEKGCELPSFEVLSSVMRIISNVSTLELHP